MTKHAASAAHALISDRGPEYRASVQRASRASAADPRGIRVMVYLSPRHGSANKSRFHSDMKTASTTNRKREPVY